MSTKTVKPILCVDLDGTVRRSKSGTFIKDEKDIELVPGIAKKLAEYKAAGYIIAAISNQGGVAYGHKTEEQLSAEWKATKALLPAKTFIYAIFATHMEGGNVHPFMYRSLLRKPDIGMLAMAEIRAKEKDIIIDWNNSLFVGYRDEDSECAANARIPFIHIDEFLKQDAPIPAPGPF